MLEHVLTAILVTIGIVVSVLAYFGLTSLMATEVREGKISQVEYLEDSGTLVFELTDKKGRGVNLALLDAKSHGHFKSLQDGTQVDVVYHKKDVGARHQPARSGVTQKFFRVTQLKVIP